MIKIRRNFYKIICLLILHAYSTLGYSQQHYSKNELTGKGDLKLVGTSTKLQPEVFKQFKKMQKAALKNGIKIQIVSGYRSYNRQLQIWNAKFDSYLSKGFSPKETVYKIIEYSTIPGTSRHHWGTDIDIIDANVKLPSKILNKVNYTKKGVYYKLHKWMLQNAYRYGFYLVYDHIPARKGFNYEPWHYSYKKLAKPMLKAYLKLNILQIVYNSNLKGASFLTTDFLDNYVNENMLDINIILK